MFSQNEYLLYTNIYSIMCQIQGGPRPRSAYTHGCIYFAKKSSIRANQFLLD